MIKIPVSVLELAIVNEGSNAKEGIENSIKIAQQADELNYNRIWYAEHHNMPHIASSATALLIQLAALNTQKIRVGSGGIMLPNHSPLVIAEQFGTLETLYPGRIDLGLGRAPGTDQLTAQALRRDHLKNAQNFPSEVEELMNYFNPKNPDSKVNAFPGKGLDVPIWILGSSTDSAYLAAQMGLPYAFATHFAPNQFFPAINIYRNHFQPSEYLEKPYMMACINAIAADSDDEAHYISSSYFNMIINLVTGNTGRGLLPAGELSELINVPDIQNAVNSMTTYSFIGSKETVQTKLEKFITDTEIDEIMVTSHIHDLETKLKSYKIVSELFN